MMAIWECPVGCCHPGTLRPLAVEGPARFCKRHFAKLSPALAKSLALARKDAEAGGRVQVDGVLLARGDAEDRLRRVLVEAITEARRHDDHWVKAFVTWVTDDGAERVEGFETGKAALRRVAALEDEGVRAEAWGGAHGQRATSRMRAGCQWSFEGKTVRGAVFGGGGESLAAAWKVFEQAVRDQGLRSSTVTWVNRVTGEEWEHGRAAGLHRLTSM